MAIGYVTRRPLRRSLRGSARKARQSSEYERILAPVIGTWVGWWTTYDTSLPTDPGLTLVLGNVSSWRDLRSGFAITQGVAGQQPFYASDGGFFNDRKVVQLTIGRYLRGPSTSPFIAAGTFPYVLMVARTRAAIQVTASKLLGFIDNAAGQYRVDPFHIAASPSQRMQSLNKNALSLALPDNSLDTASHIFKFFCGSSASILKMFPGPEVSAAAAPLDGLIDYMTLGAETNGTGSNTEFSIAEIIVLTDEPGPEIEAQLIDAMTEKWGTLSTPPSPPTPERPPLPANTVEYWQSEFGASRASAIGQIVGRTVPGLNAPTVAPDLGYFNGRPVYRSTQIGSHCWLIGSVSPLIANAGDRPWIYFIGRHRTLSPTTGQSLCGLSTLAGGDIMVLGSTSTGVFQVIGSGWVCQAGPRDTAVHRMKTWTVGTQTNLSIDDVLTTNPTSGTAIAGKIIGVGIGCDSGASAGLPSDSSIALFLVCSAQPTPAEEAALDAWAKAYYFPPPPVTQALTIQGNPLTIQGNPLVITQK